jgi:hypothetical protein
MTVKIQYVISNIVTLYYCILLTLEYSIFQTINILMKKPSLTIAIFPICISSHSQTATEFLLKGKSLFESQKYEKAIIEFTNSLNLDAKLLYEKKCEK